MSVIIGNASQIATVGASSVAFTNPMAASTVYVLTSTTAAWFTIDATPTAAAHVTGSHYLPANTPREIAALGPQNKVAIIQDAAGGFASLSQTE